MEKYQTNFAAILDKILVDGQLPQNAEFKPTGMQAGLVTEWIRRQHNAAEIFGWVNSIKVGSTAHNNRPFIQSLYIPFATLVRDNLAAVNSHYTLTAGKNWTVFPFDEIANNACQADGTVFSSEKIVLPFSGSFVSGIALRDEDKLDVDILRTSVEFCQLVTPVPTKYGVEWNTDKETLLNRELGVGMSAKSVDGVSLRDCVDPPTSEQHKNCSTLEYVYSTIASTVDVVQDAVVNAITTVKWNNTITHPQYSSIYKVGVDGARFVIKGRDSLNFMPLAAEVPDLDLFCYIDKLVAKANSTRHFGYWYYGASYQQHVKNVVEGCQLVDWVRKHGPVDVYGFGRNNAFAATWNASKLSDGVTIACDANFDASSKVLARGRTSFLKKNDIMISFGAVADVAGRFNDNTRKETIILRIIKLIEIAKEEKYKYFYFRVPIGFLEVDKSNDFLILGVGFVLDVDVISGHIWLTNYPGDYISGKKTIESKEYSVFVGGAKIREILCICVGARFMVNQTHVGFKNYFTLVSKPFTRIVYSFGMKVVAPVKPLALDALHKGGDFHLGGHGHIEKKNQFDHSLLGASKTIPVDSTISAKGGVQTNNVPQNVQIQQPLNLNTNVSSSMTPQNGFAMGSSPNGFGAIQPIKPSGTLGYPQVSTQNTNLYSNNPNTVGSSLWGNDGGNTSQEKL